MKRISSHTLMGLSVALIVLAISLTLLAACAARAPQVETTPNNNSALRIIDRLDSGSLSVVVVYDSARKATCWISMGYSTMGNSCIADSQLK